MISRPEKKVIKALRSQLDEAKGERRLLETQMKATKGDLKSAKHLSLQIEKAKAVVDMAAEATQKNLEAQITGVVSTALASVFPNPYELDLEFGSARGMPEARLTFSRDDVTGLDPLEEAGIGPVDIASIACRMAVLCMGEGEPLLLLDEPFRDLNVIYHKQTGEMLKELCGELRLQVLLVTHSTVLTENFDRVWDIELVNGRSKVAQR